MRIPKHDLELLADILEAIRRIEEYTQNGKYVFFESTLIQDAVIRNFEIIGEAANKFTFVSRWAKEIQWRKIIAFRNVLIHEYSKIDIELVWDTVDKEMPELKERITTITGKTGNGI